MGKSNREKPMLRDENTGDLFCGWHTPKENDGFCGKPAITVVNTTPVCEEHAAVATGPRCVCFFCSVPTLGVPVFVTELSEQAQRIVANRPPREPLPCDTKSHRVGCCPKHKRRHHDPSK